ncbi:protein of unknown function [Pararobbsia alpina]
MQPPDQLHALSQEMDNPFVGLRRGRERAHSGSQHHPGETDERAAANNKTQSRELTIDRAPRRYVERNDGCGGDNRIGKMAHESGFPISRHKTSRRSLVRCKHRPYRDWRGARDGSELTATLASVKYIHVHIQVHVALWARRYAC